MSNSPKVILSGRALIINQNQELLLVSHPGSSFWYTPGGGLEGAESFLDCAKREVLEEIGIKVELEKLIFVDDFISDYKDEVTRAIAFFFFGQTDQEIPEQWEDVGGDAPIIAKFFSEKELAELETVYPSFLKTDFWKAQGNGFKDHQVYQASTKMYKGD